MYNRETLGIIEEIAKQLKEPEGPVLRRAPALLVSDVMR